MASSQNQQYPTQPQQSPVPDYDKHHPNTGSQNQNAPVPPPQYQAPQQYQQYAPHPPPPGTYIGTTLHTPQQSSWVSSGANVAGVVIAGRCLIGFVTSGIFLIITSLIMFVQANNFDIINRRGTIHFTNPLRIMAPIFLTLGIAFLVGGIIGIVCAINAVKKRRAEAFTTTSTVTIGAAPVLAGTTNLQGQHNQAYYGAAYPQGAQFPPSSQGQGGYPQQAYGQAPVPQGHNVSSNDQHEAPPPYHPAAGSNVPLQKY